MTVPMSRFRLKVDIGHFRRCVLQRYGFHFDEPAALPSDPMILLHPKQYSDLLFSYHSPELEHGMLFYPKPLPTDEQTICFSPVVQARERSHWRRLISFVLDDSGSMGHSNLFNKCKTLLLYLADQLRDGINFDRESSLEINVAFFHGNSVGLKLNNQGIFRLLIMRNIEV